MKKIKASQVRQWVKDEEETNKYRANPYITDFKNMTPDQIIIEFLIDHFMMTDEDEE